MRIALLLLVASLAGSCAAPSRDPATGAATVPVGTPSTVQLDAAEGWRAEVALDVAEVGIWTVEPLDVWPQYAGAEVIGLDDRGRCHVLVPYAGRWTHFQVADDGAWLGAADAGDVDPRVPGRELYVAGISGAVYQVVGHADGLLDARRIARIEGRAVHTLIAADLDAARDGVELIAFTEPAMVYLLTPHADRDGFAVTALGPCQGRVREAVRLPGRRPDGSERVAVVSRAGELALIDGLEPPRLREVFRATQGLGRVALAPGSTEERVVLYTAADDGPIHRHEGRAEGPFTSEMIYAGPTGPRGIAAGRFDAAVDAEQIAVFGYSARVEVLTRPADGAGPWSVETLFTDRGAGHWLSHGEYDARNATDEILLSGYGGRIVMLAREPGHGLQGVAIEP